MIAATSSGAPYVETDEKVKRLKVLVQDKEARDDEVESLRIKLQRLERSLQEKEDTMEELRGRQYHPH